MKKKYVTIVLNLFIAVMSYYSWLSMMLGANGALSSQGLGSLKYFTILSNLFSGTVSFIYLIAILRNKVNRELKVWKYYATVAVTLTFVVVMVFLGPLFTYKAMFMGMSFWLHLVLPLMAVGEFVLLNKEEITPRENLLAVLSMVIYGIGYLGNILINGRGQWPQSNDWYGFLLWGWGVGIIIYFVITFVTWLIGFVLRKANKKFSL